MNQSKPYVLYSHLLLLLVYLAQISLFKSNANIFHFIITWVSVKGFKS